MARNDARTDLSSPSDMSTMRCNVGDEKKKSNLINLRVCGLLTRGCGQVNTGSCSSPQSLLLTPKNLTTYLDSCLFESLYPLSLVC